MGLSGEDLSLLLFTLRIAALSTLAILPLGIVLAALLARWDSPLKRILETVISLPLVLPPTAVGLMLLELLRPDSGLGHLLTAMGIEVVFTWKAVVVATAVMSFPLLVRPARAAFEEVDPRLLNVARTLGAGPLAVFARVWMPLAWRGVTAGALLAFSRALGEFGATIIVAGNIPGRTQTLALAIFQRNEIGDDRGAFRLVLVTVVAAFAIVWLTESAARRHSRGAAS